MCLYVCLAKLLVFRLLCLIYKCVCMAISQVTNVLTYFLILGINGQLDIHSCIFHVSQAFFSYIHCVSPFLRFSVDLDYFLNCVCGSLNQACLKILPLFSSSMVVTSIENALFVVVLYDEPIYIIEWRGSGSLCIKF